MLKLKRGPFNCEVTGGQRKLHMLYAELRNMYSPTKY